MIQIRSRNWWCISLKTIWLNQNKDRGVEENDDIQNFTCLCPVRLSSQPHNYRQGWRPGEPGHCQAWHTCTVSGWSSLHHPRCHLCSWRDNSDHQFHHCWVGLTSSWCSSRQFHQSRSRCPLWQHLSLQSRFSPQFHWGQIPRCWHPQYQLMPTLLHCHSCSWILKQPNLTVKDIDWVNGIYQR